MWLRALAALAFTAWMAFLLVRPDPDWASAIFVLFLGANVLGWPAYFERRERDREQLLRWLTHNEDEIRAGGAAYRGVWVRRDTALVTYWCAFSLLVVSVLIPVGPYLAEDRRGRMHRNVLLVASMAYGWWGLPWGPVHTVKAVWRDLAPKRVDVATYMRPPGWLRHAPRGQTSTRRGRPSVL